MLKKVVLLNSYVKTETNFFIDS